MPTASRLELLFLHSSNIYKVNRSVCFSMKLLEWRREYDDSVGGIKTPGKGNCLFHMNQCPARLWNSGLVMQSLDSQMQHNHGEQTKATNGLSSSHDLYPVNIKPPIMILFLDPMMGVGIDGIWQSTTRLYRIFHLCLVKKIQWNGSQRTAPANNRTYFLTSISELLCSFCLINA